MSDFWQIPSSKIEEIYIQAKILKDNLEKASAGKEDFLELRRAYNFFKEYISFEIVSEHIKKVENYYPKSILIKPFEETKIVSQSEYINFKPSELENHFLKAF